MSKRKACKSCKMMVEGDICPVCKGEAFTQTWQGRVYIADPQSQVAEKTGMKVKGEYAIKVR